MPGRLQAGGLRRSAELSHLPRRLGPKACGDPHRSSPSVCLWSSQPSFTLTPHSRTPVCGRLRCESEGFGGRSGCLTLSSAGDQGRRRSAPWVTPEFQRLMFCSVTQCPIQAGPGGQHTGAQSQGRGHPSQEVPAVLEEVAWLVESLSSLCSARYKGSSCCFTPLSSAQRVSLPLEKPEGRV